MIQTLVPAIRVLAQIFGVIAGKQTGIMIIQATQLITIIGGPAGYILITNIFVSETVEPSRRTAVFGRLQGSIMLGQSVGYLGMYAWNRFSIYTSIRTANSVHAMESRRDAWRCN